MRRHPWHRLLTARLGCSGHLVWVEEGERPQCRVSFVEVKYDAGRLLERPGVLAGAGQDGVTRDELSDEDRFIRHEDGLRRAVMTETG